MHSFLITAPQVVIHLYTVTVSANPDMSLSVPSSIPLIALVACVVSLVYTVLAFTTADRLSGKKRRVVLSASVVQTIWYGCLVAARIIAFGLFAHAYGSYVFVVVAVHWIAVFFGLLNLRTTFCSDVTTEPRKSRWYLEVPFNFIASCTFIFVYINLKKGNTRIPVTVYHVLTFIENTTMILLFYFDQSQLWYAPWSIAIVSGFFLLGVFCMIIYFLVLHPEKTKTWYWIGIPRKGSDCCVWNRDTLTPESGSRNRNVEISGPTLVSLNGAVPTFPLTRNTISEPSQFHASGMESRQPQNRNVGSGMQTNYPIPRITTVPNRPTSTNTTGASIDSPISSLNDVQPTSPSTYHRESEHSHYDTLLSASSFGQKTDSTTFPEGRSQMSDPALMGNDTDVSSPSHPRFKDIPAKKPNYRSGLERHYFPDGYRRNTAADKFSSPRPPLNQVHSGPDHFKFPSPTHQTAPEQSGQGQGSVVHPSPQRNRSSYTQQHSPERTRQQASGYQGRRNGGGQIPTSTTLYGEGYSPPQRERRAAASDYRNVNIPGGEIQPDRLRFDQWKDRNVNVFNSLPDHSRDASWSSSQSKEKPPPHKYSSPKHKYGVNRSPDKQTAHLSPERPKNVHWSHSIPLEQPPKRTSWSVDRDTRAQQHDQFEQRPRAFSDGSHTKRVPAVNRGTSQSFQGRTPPARNMPATANTNLPGKIWLSDIKSAQRTPRDNYVPTTVSSNVPAHMQYHRPPNYPVVRPNAPIQPHNPLWETGSHGNRPAGQSRYRDSRQNPLIRMPTANAPVSQV